MILKFSGIEFVCKATDNSNRLVFFQERDTSSSSKHNQSARKHIAVVYGRNGSGKSTVARAFRKSKGDTIDDIHEVRLFSHDDSDLVDEGTENQNVPINVFDHLYVENNVSFKEDGIGTIVLIGEQVQLETKLEELEKKIDDIVDATRSVQEKIELAQDKSNLQSPKHWLSRVESTLRADQSWASFDASIRGLGQKAAVNEKVIERIMNCQTSSSPEDLRQKLDLKIEDLEKFNKNESHLPPLNVKLSLDPNDERIVSLLSESIEKPTMDERDKRLIALVEDKLYGRHYLEDSKFLFSNSEVEYCPLCQQHVSQQHKAELIESIERILSEKVEKHVKELKDFIFDLNLPDLKLDQYEEVDAKLVQKTMNGLVELKSCVDDRRAKIEEKINNPYEPIYYESKVNETIREIRDNVSILRKKIDEYNNSIPSKEVLIKEAQAFNDQIAFLKIREDYKNYVKQKKMMVELQRKKDELTKANNDTLTEKRQLNAKSQSVDIAANMINEHLAFIFCDSNRLKLIAKEDTYVLESHGKPIKPRQLSTGEKNVIALSHFFLNISKEQSARQMYEQTSLCIIDDPISSFDIDNSVGVFSFLYNQMNLILKANPHSKIILLTHDLTTLFSIYDVYRKKCDYYRLNKFQMIPFNNEEIRHYNEFSALINGLYDYSTEAPATFVDDYTVGNVARRVLEAYATFMYKKGVTQFLEDEHIAASFDDTTLVALINRRLYRLVLHGTSHFENKIKAMNFHTSFTREEKVDTAKTVLLLLWKLNPAIVSAHLTNREYERVLNCWLSDLKEFSKQV